MRRHPRSTRTDTLLPCTTLFRSDVRQDHTATLRGEEPRDAGPEAGPCAGHQRYLSLQAHARSSRGKCGCRRAAVSASLARQPRPWTFGPRTRSEEHTSELQSLMRISYAVFCLKKKKITTQTIGYQHLTENKKPEENRMWHKKQRNN